MNFCCFGEEVVFSFLPFFFVSLRHAKEIDDRENWSLTVLCLIYMFSLRLLFFSMPSFRNNTQKDKKKTESFHTEKNVVFRDSWIFVGCFWFPHLLEPKNKRKDSVENKMAFFVLFFPILKFFFCFVCSFEVRAKTIYVKSKSKLYIFDIDNSCTKRVFWMLGFGVYHRLGTIFFFRKVNKCLLFFFYFWGRK